MELSRKMLIQVAKEECKVAVSFVLGLYFADSACSQMLLCMFSVFTLP